MSIWQLLLRPYINLLTSLRGDSEKSTLEALAAKAERQSPEHGKWRAERPYSFSSAKLLF